MKYRIEFSKAAIRDLDRMWAEVFEASRSNDTSNQYITDLLDFTEKNLSFQRPAARFITKTALPDIITSFSSHISSSIVWKKKRWLSTGCFLEKAIISDS